MSAEPTPRSAESRRRTRQLSKMAVHVSLRELSLQLAMLNRQVGRHLDLREVDLDCLDILSRHGPMGTSTLARTAGLHPATLTGALDRLGETGSIVPERDPDHPPTRAVTT